MDINRGAQQDPRYSSARFNEKGCPYLHNILNFSAIFRQSGSIIHQVSPGLLEQLGI
jgi:hypothetical protein